MCVTKFKGINILIASILIRSPQLLLSGNLNMSTGVTGGNHFEANNAPNVTVLLPQHNIEDQIATATVKQVSRPSLCRDIEELHQRACEEGKMTYIDPPTGYTVLTELSHMKRGSCCGNACRHCPYDHCNVKSKQKPLK